MNKEELARRIYELSHLQGEFELRSGLVSSEYFDKYLFEADPAALQRIAERLTEIVPEGTEVLAGLEMGGIPVVTALSLASGVPAAFVRKKAKAYGTCKIAEGAPVAGKRVCIVEDVVTTGGQVLLSAEDLRRAGAVVEDVLCVIERLPEGREKLKAAGLTLHSLYRMEELAAAGKPGEEQQHEQEQAAL
ncbi:orotate phosphoribosyltransferase [Paenibacillus sp. J31TS4]|uniref:orotate phosphoribosyltransferase n=1 Tax=Paenibacillus sp. J31TS4 TaxID=2807195 RepID=UPI001B218F04|nr:orotate phosphoribosyltransferase [Paenibacillus sp. J31TS4]GIP39106.1 orotate phosphoribosyltransferase [Paenibacillus sp. J31TS4]